jgi:hypothetical protein
MMRARVLSALATCAFAAACAAEKTTAAPAGNGGAGAAGSVEETHPAEWFQIGAAREDLKTSEVKMDASMSDCESACKALASLERAVNHICAVAEPEECSDARMRALKARKAVNSTCGGC